MIGKSVCSSVMCFKKADSDMWFVGQFENGHGIFLWWLCVPGIIFFSDIATWKAVSNISSVSLKKYGLICQVFDQDDMGALGKF